MLILHFVASPVSVPRFGITTPRKVGGAVVRNRLRRRVREVLRRWPERRSLPPLDVVVHLKPEAATATHQELRAELERLLVSLTSSNPERRGRPRRYSSP